MSSAKKGSRRDGPFLIGLIKNIIAGSYSNNLNRSSLRSDSSVYTGHKARS